MNWCLSAGRMTSVFSSFITRLYVSSQVPVCMDASKQHSRARGFSIRTILQQVQRLDTPHDDVPDLRKITSAEGDLCGEGIVRVLLLVRENHATHDDSSAVKDLTIQEDSLRDGSGIRKLDGCILTVAFRPNIIIDRLSDGDTTPSAAPDLDAGDCPAVGECVEQDAFSYGGLDLIDGSSDGWRKNATTSTHVTDVDMSIYSGPRVSPASDQSYANAHDV
jgi:hypothetical protein